MNYHKNQINKFKKIINKTKMFYYRSNESKSSLINKDENN